MIEPALSRILLHNWDSDPGTLIDWANDLRGKPSPEHEDVILGSIESFQLIECTQGEGYYIVVLFSVVQKDTLAAAYIEKLFTAL